MTRAAILAAFVLAGCAAGEVEKAEAAPCCMSCDAIPPAADAQQGACSPGHCEVNERYCRAPGFDGGARE